MSRASHKQLSVAERLLIVLLSGRPVTIDEITTTLQGKLVPVRIPTYLWELKTRGAVITRMKIGKKTVSYTLVNPDVMYGYLSARKSAGANVPDLPGMPTVASVIETADVQELVTA